MASKIELVRSELAFYGISVMNDGQCLSFIEGQDRPVKSTFQDKIQQLQYDIENHKEGVLSFWSKLIKVLQTPQHTFAGGSPSTEKMYVAAMKQLLKFSRRYKHFRKYSRFIQWILRNDVKRFNETTMSKAIDFKICIDWLDHLVRRDTYCIQLISFFDKHRSMMQTAIEKKIPVIAQQLVPPGSMDMEGDEHDPFKERRWKWDENDFKDDVRPQNMEAWVGNDPEWLNEGFYWYTPETEPFAYGDKDNDPYRNKYKQTHNRGYDK